MESVVTAAVVCTLLFAGSVVTWVTVFLLIRQERAVSEPAIGGSATRGTATDPQRGEVPKKAGDDASGGGAPAKKHRREDKELRLAPWRAVAASVWVMGVVVVGLVTHLDADLHPCRTTIVDTDQAATETVTHNATGAVTGRTTTEGGGTTDRTTTCAPPGAGDLALLLLPVLILAFPAIEAFNFPFGGATMRDVTERASAGALVLLVANTVGKRTEEALSQLQDERTLVDLEELTK